VVRSDPFYETPFMVVTLKYHQRQLVDGSDPFYKLATTGFGNTTNGSWWFVKVQPRGVAPNNYVEFHQRQLVVR
jgi:hypothetical protein